MECVLERLHTKSFKHLIFKTSRMGIIQGLTIGERELYAINKLNWIESNRIQLIIGCWQISKYDAFWSYTFLTFLYFSSLASVRYFYENGTFGVLAMCHIVESDYLTPINQNCILIYLKHKQVMYKLSLSLFVEQTILWNICLAWHRHRHWHIQYCI